jgi:hypothetical protein
MSLVRLLLNKFLERLVTSLFFGFHRSGPPPSVAGISLLLICESHLASVFIQPACLKQHSHLPQPYFAVNRIAG